MARQQAATSPNRSLHSGRPFRPYRTGPFRIDFAPDNSPSGGRRGNRWPGCCWQSIPAQVLPMFHPHGCSVAEAATRSVAQEADAVVKLVQAGILPPLPTRWRSWAIPLMRLPRSAPPSAPKFSTRRGVGVGLTDETAAIAADDFQAAMQSSPMKHRRQARRIINRRNITKTDKVVRLAEVCSNRAAQPLHC